MIDLRILSLIVVVGVLGISIVLWAIFGEGDKKKPKEEPLDDDLFPDVPDYGENFDSLPYEVRDGVLVFSDDMCALGVDSAVPEKSGRRYYLTMGKYENGEYRWGRLSAFTEGSHFEIGKVYMIKENKLREAGVDLEVAFGGEKVYDVTSIPPQNYMPGNEEALSVMKSCVEMQKTEEDGIYVEFRI